MNKKRVLIFVFILLALLMSNAVIAQTIGGAFKNGLVSINNFFTNEGYKPFAKVIDFVFFSIVFLSLFTIGAKNVFKQYTRPVQTIVILFGLALAFVFVIANISIANLVPFAWYILYILLFVFFYWLLGKLGMKSKFWKFLLALLLLLLVILLISGIAVPEGKTYFGSLSDKFKAIQVPGLPEAPGLPGQVQDLLQPAGPTPSAPGAPKDEGLVTTRGAPNLEDEKISERIGSFGWIGLILLGILALGGLGGAGYGAYKGYGWWRGRRGTKETITIETEKLLSLLKKLKDIQDNIIKHIEEKKELMVEEEAEKFRLRHGEVAFIFEYRNKDIQKRKLNDLVKVLKINDKIAKYCRTSINFEEEELKLLKYLDVLLNKKWEKKRKELAALYYGGPENKFGQHAIPFESRINDDERVRDLMLGAKLIGIKKKGLREMDVLFIRLHQLFVKFKEIINKENFEALIPLLRILKDIKKAQKGGINPDVNWPTSINKYERQFNKIFNEEEWTIYKNLKDTEEDKKELLQKLEKVEKKEEEIEEAEERAEEEHEVGLTVKIISPEKNSKHKIGGYIEELGAEALGPDAYGINSGNIAYMQFHWYIEQGEKRERIHIGRTGPRNLISWAIPADFVPGKAYLEVFLFDAKENKVDDSKKIEIELYSGAEGERPTEAHTEPEQKESINVNELLSDYNSLLRRPFKERDAFIGKWKPISLRHHNREDKTRLNLFPEKLAMLSETDPNEGFLWEIKLDEKEYAILPSFHAYIHLPYLASDKGRGAREEFAGIFEVKTGIGKEFRVREMAYAELWNDYYKVTQKGILDMPI